MLNDTQLSALSGEHQPVSSLTLAGEPPAAPRFAAKKGGSHRRSLPGVVKSRLPPSRCASPVAGLDITFPDKQRKSELHKLWVKQCRHQPEPSCAARICSAHFLPDDINRILKRAHVKERAVPQCFKLPDHL
ncbi:hypothetical protein ATANTOWER_007133 [Ataeniobius toweri]|uniref:THAP-type domain-containing protein n=1 Tax=Ataeniobius toweri TaxID=208326 RepID=A0ABU7A535_9TELE|nr:hypothetical protein [Ataeniobius toweri]